MFIAPSLKPSKSKRTVYLVAASILGLQINYFILVGIQVVILQWLLHSEKNILWYIGYPPFIILLCAFLLSGILWGFMAGRYWWRIIYIEHRFRKPTSI